MHPDHIQIPEELVNHIIDFFHDTPTDLKACALASRAFVYAAQSHIFNELSIAHYGATTSDIDDLWSRCQETLHASPHLIQHIHRLAIHPHTISSDTFSAICNFPFTHLTEVCTSTFPLSSPFAIALQQLFSLHTLRFVDLRCYFNNPSSFIQLWDRCAPGIKHLDFTCYQTSTDALRPASQHWPAAILLDSFRIAEIKGIRDWMDHALCPFDFSGLKVLSCSRPEVLRWPQITPALQTVKALDFTPSSYDDDSMIDLSTFPCLVFLRISIEWPHAWPMALNTLSTIAPLNHIRKIVICGLFANGIAAEELDSRLSSLPMHHSPAFHFEMHPNDYDRLAPTLHRLSSTNMLRRAERHHDDWFQNYTRALW
ncbi:hypothetical protein DFH09DRAFT_1188197 [Mycena vulgaris]|nr:hypothetical protein DFH09DRAFT_1188197 [Mycena vulgaris]